MNVGDLVWFKLSGWTFLGRIRSFNEDGSLARVAVTDYAWVHILDVEKIHYVWPRLEPGTWKHSSHSTGQ